MSEPTVVYELSPRLDLEATLGGWGDRFPRSANALRLVAECGCDAPGEDALLARGAQRAALDRLVELGALVRVRVPEGDPGEEGGTPFRRFLGLLDGGRA